MIFYGETPFWKKGSPRTPLPKTFAFFVAELLPAVRFLVDNFSSRIGALLKLRSEAKRARNEAI